MLKNRKCLPAYYSQGTIIIKESGYYGGSNSALMQGFGVDAGYKNVNNQVIMLGSYDLMCRVVDSLPFMQTEYITQGRFKTRNLYRQTPILIETTRIEPMAYSILFQVEIQQDGLLTIVSTDETIPMRITAHYYEPIHCPLFDAVIRPSDMSISEGKISFRFRSKSSLVDEFMGLAEIYLLQNLEQKNEVADNSIRFINQQLITLQSSLEVSEGAMTQFRQENKFVDVGSYAGQLMGRISQYDQQDMALKLRETYFD